MKFRPLTVNSLPRAMINIVAMDDENIRAFFDEFKKRDEFVTWGATALRNDPELFGTDKTKVVDPRYLLVCFFSGVLNLSKVTRSFFVKDFDRLLSELGSQDFWGTEGQCDPRGDRRYELKYDR